jgi:hypothetical protein
VWVGRVSRQQRGAENERIAGVRVLHQAIRSEDTGREDGTAGLGGPVGRAEDGEDNGAGTAHGSEEGLRTDRLRLGGMIPGDGHVAERGMEGVGKTNGIDGTVVMGGAGTC